MAKPRAKKASPFDVDLSPAKRDELAQDLARDVEDALNARSAMIGDGGLIDLYDWFYEQGRSDPADRPFPGAADLTSYFITENVDALRSRLVKSVFGVRPFCFVEGWGQDAAKAPFVEEFHDWQARKSGLKSELAKVVHGALLEDGYILEVSERIETRRIVEEIDAALALNELQQPVFDQSNQPKLQLDEFGDPVPAQDGQPSARIERRYTKTRRLGPQYDAISLKDFVFLPGHAKNQKEVYGYAYRIWPRLAELKERVKDGIYDAAAVQALGESDERQDGETPAAVTDVATQYGDNAQKELFQLSLKRDLDGDGREEWYIATISIKTQMLLRLKLDTFVMKVGRPRCVPFVFFPRRNSVYGYSYAGDKLLTLAEEHTALRNMAADRSALATNAPMTKLRSSHWDPNSQPIGVGRVIDVNEHNEIKPMVINDVPQSAILLQNMLIQAKERVGGLADAFVGVMSEEQRTLGENRLVAGGSAVRVDEINGHLHAAISEVMLLTHAIWIETLEADPRGLAAPTGVLDALKARGVDLANGRFTASQLKGDFQFEPYGSDDTANPDKQRSDFNNSLMALANLAKVFPELAVIFQNKEAARWILQEWARRYNVRNRQPFMGAFDAPAAPPATGNEMGAPMAAAAPGAPAAAAPPNVPQGMPAGPMPPNPLIAMLRAMQQGNPGVTGVQ